jgi:hypothetical protein
MSAVCGGQFRQVSNLPIVNLTSLVSKLVALLTKPDTKAYYGQMLAQYNVDRQFRLDHNERLKTANPRAIAARADLDILGFAKYMVDRAFGTVDAPKLLDPVEVGEIVSGGSSVYLYRAYDGIDASTLGSWWSEGGLLREITSASPCHEEGKLNHAQVLKFMLSSAFVHPYWNEGKDVARMTIPVGSRVPVITGRGDWRAMMDAQPREQSRLPKNAAAAPKRPNDLKINSEEDVHKKLGMAPIPGVRQIFVPLFKDMWVAKIPHLSPEWPFA